MKLPEDPVILELLPEFVDTWITDIASQFKVLLETKNSDEMYRLGHTLKGSCFQFGLDDVAQMGIQLMAYARNQEWDNAADLEMKIRNTFDEVKSFLQAKGIM